MQNESNDVSDLVIDLKKLFTILLRWTWLLVLGAVMSAVASFLFSQRQTPVYEATTSILVTRSSVPTVADLSQTLSLSQVVDTYVRMMSADEFLDIVSQKMGYQVETENVNVVALPNTQVIQLQVQDIDPVRAALTADTMVKILREQNAAMQAGRYAEVEKSLDAQILDTEKQIADLQAKLDAAKNAALIAQITQAKVNIDTTVDDIQVTTLELDRLNKLGWEKVQDQLANDKTRLAEQQVLLDQQIAENEKLKSTYASDPKVKTDLKYAALIKQQTTDLVAKIVQTRISIQEIQKEIDSLTPFATEQDFLSTIIKKENLLKTQQSQLAAYQSVYSTLLSTGEAKSTSEIDGLKQNLMLYQNTDIGLVSSREDIKKQKLQNTPPIEQIRPALASTTPVRPRTMLNTLLGGAAGLIIALFFVTLREMTDGTIKDSKEFGKLLNTKAFGYIPNIKNVWKGKGIYVDRAPYSPAAEAFRALRTSLEFSAREKPVKTILVTSGGRAEGKTTVASNLAAILSQPGRKVVLMDANLRRPCVHQYTGISNTSGLSELIGSEKELDLDCYIQQLDNLPYLSILPGGEVSPNPTDLLRSEKMKDLLRTLSGVYDYTIIDCSPVLAADAQVLLSQVDGVILVVVPGKTSKEVVQAVDEKLKQSGARLLGVVLNRLQRAPGIG
jgi:capsular exopolysaccharide synthesis family protein